MDLNSPKIETNVMESATGRRKPFYRDSAIWSILISNLIVIVMAAAKGWQFKEIAMTYWFQSVALCSLWLIKIYAVKDFFKEDLTVVGDFCMKNRKAFQKMLEENPTAISNMITESHSVKDKNTAACRLAIAIGFFHIAYFCILLTAMKVKLSTDLLLPVLVLCLSTIFSFFYNKEWKTKGRVNIDRLTKLPFYSIIPMHLIIMLYGVFSMKVSSMTILVIFMLLKTIADTAMHATTNNLEGSLGKTFANSKYKIRNKNKVNQ